MAIAAPFAYNQILYGSKPMARTHPDRLATVATLMGLQPAPVENCRVLELGCGDGANLIPMAYTLPNSHFVGVDLAKVPIQNAQALALQAALPNIEFREMDLRAVNADFGSFDYIIAHGLYSWVPAAVRDKLLAVCQARLAPNGVAYISYNAYPGCHVRHIVRGMLLYETREIREPDLKLQKALDFLNFLQTAEPKGSILRQELEEARSLSAPSLFHDDLSDVNDPVYFYEFVEHAARHGLQFLGEADMFEMHAGRYPREVQETLSLLAGGNIVLKEQYLDFLKCRRFRATLLCHQDVMLDRSAGVEKIPRFYVASRARPESPQPDVRSSATETFTYPERSSATTNIPLFKAALVLLGETWPLSLSFRELLSGARGRIDSVSEEDARSLANLLLQTHAAGVVELHSMGPKFTLEPGERPAASAVVRLQIGSTPLVPTLRHTSARIEDPGVRRLLLLLDGTRDRRAIQQALSIPGPHLEEALKRLARLALLIQTG